MLKQAHDENNNIICLGDMNKNFLGNLPHNVNDILVINELVNIINKPTHFDARSGNTSLLDPILIPIQYRLLIVIQYLLTGK